MNEKAACGILKETLRMMLRHNTLFPVELIRANEIAISALERTVAAQDDKDIERLGMNISQFDTAHDLRVARDFVKMALERQKGEQNEAGCK